MRTFLLLFLLLFISCTNRAQQNLQTIVKERKIPKSELIIKIDKSAYTLSVWHKEEQLISYPCVFGFNPVDDKQQEGDGCTPEGEFKIKSMYAHASWKYFIWIDYPNKESRKRFNERKAEGAISSDASIGGEIGIHGVPEGSDAMIANKTNWTLGCISLTREHITDLYKSISSGTKILIEK